MTMPRMSEVIPVTLDPDIRPWERQPGEPARWYHRFYNFFRPLGPERTLPDCWRWWKDEDGMLLPGNNMSPAWCVTQKKWRWRERAHAWDEYQQTLNMEKEEKYRAAASKRHIDNAMKMQMLGMKKVEDTLDRFKGNPDAVQRMSSEDARKLVSTGIQIEKEAMGMPTWIVQIMSMDNVELERRYAQLLAEIGGHGRVGKDAGLEPDTDTDDSEEF